MGLDVERLDGIVYFEIRQAVGLGLVDEEMGREFWERWSDGERMRWEERLWRDD